ncbi:MAG: hypothetical protein JNM17_31670 [Archangium sp.]|nr:hypothetical protein [Archangium sp.]
MSFTVKQLQHFSDTLELDFDEELLEKLHAAGELTTPVEFFELIAPQLKDHGVSTGPRIVSGLNKRRKQPLDRVLIALGIDEDIATALSAEGAELDDVRNFAVDEIANRAKLPSPAARKVLAQLEALAPVFDGLDGELQISAAKKAKKK